MGPLLFLLAAVREAIHKAERGQILPLVPQMGRLAGTPEQAPLAGVPSRADITNHLNNRLTPQRVLLFLKL
jgi:hypothetical protein